MAATFDAMAILAEILAEHGPLHKDDLAQQLRERGVADPDSELQWNLIELDCPVRRLVDDRWVWLPALLAGRMFTHQVGADEVARDMLHVTPDLQPITALCDHEEFQRLADGSAVSVVVADYGDELLEERGIPPEALDPGGALLLEVGTLSRIGVAEGDVVGVQLTEDGLEVGRVDVAAHSTAGPRLAATLDPEEPTYFDVAVWTACVADPGLFTAPLPPLQEIVENYGLAWRDEWVAPGGFDFDRWDLERRTERLATRYDLDLDDASAIAAMLSLYEQTSYALASAYETDDAATVGEADAAGDPEEDLLGQLGAALADPLLAEVLVAETVGDDCGGAPALGLFAETLEPRVPRAARVACRWLQAVALERLGDIEEAEQQLLAAEAIDPDWPLPLIDLARIASIRGDADRGLGLMRRAGTGPDDPLVALLQRFRADQRAELGRNEPCWCGSGRKYKKCHLGNEQLPLTDRVSWLYAKAVDHVLVTGWKELLTRAGFERYCHTHDAVDAITEGMRDPLVMDAVLCEGGAFAEFLEVRGGLLPDDERLLAEQWLLVERSVFEVEGVKRGESVAVRDIRTGDRHDVRERTASRYLKPRQLICTRVLPDGESMQFFGGVDPVALHERDGLLEVLDAEPDPVEIVSALSRRFAPPALTNTEGDPVAICKATVQVGNRDIVETALDNTFERVDGSEPPRWHENITTHGMPRIRAMLVLDGDMLRVETNSDRRMDRVLTTVIRLDPTMRVLNDSRRAIRNTRDAAELAKQMPPQEGMLDPDDPEVAEMLDAYVREYESKWLDLPIPALAGHTPRQAADDPTRRDDLIKLLDTFPAGDAARGGMDADRLRAALGLR